MGMQEVVSGRGNGGGRRTASAAGSKVGVGRWTRMVHCCDHDHCRLEGTYHMPRGVEAHADTQQPGVHCAYLSSPNWSLPLLGELSLTKPHSPSPYNHQGFPL